MPSYFEGMSACASPDHPARKQPACCGSPPVQVVYVLHDASFTSEAATESTERNIGICSLDPAQQQQLMAALCKLPDVQCTGHGSTTAYGTQST